LTVRSARRDSSFSTAHSLHCPAGETAVTRGANMLAARRRFFLTVAKGCPIFELAGGPTPSYCASDRPLPRERHATSRCIRDRNPMSNRVFLAVASCFALLLGVVSSTATWAQALARPMAAPAIE